MRAHVSLLRLMLTLSGCVGSPEPHKPDWEPGAGMQATMMPADCLACKGSAARTAYFASAPQALERCAVACWFDDPQDDEGDCESDPSGVTPHKGADIVYRIELVPQGICPNP